jgi:hypothetical protein
MRKTISTYWPVAMLVPIALGFVDADGDWQPAGSMPAVAAAPRVL